MTGSLRGLGFDGCKINTYNNPLFYIYHLNNNIIKG